MTTNMIRIWNWALGFLGCRNVASEYENTPEALQCRLYWDAARRQVLRDFPWPFAQRRAWLAQLPLPPEYAPEFRHAYAPPEDCLKVHEVRQQGGSPRPFLLAHNSEGNGSMILTDAEQALALYTADIADCRLFDSQTGPLLARKLAALLAIPLLQCGMDRVNDLERLYAAACPAARTSAASERQEAASGDAWLDAR